MGRADCVSSFTLVLEHYHVLEDGSKAEETAPDLTHG